MDEELRKYVLDAISSIVGKKRTIHEDTCLYHDLNISGDDAAELLEKIHRKFGTDFKSMNFSEYFPNEGEAIYFHIMKIFGKHSKKAKLTIRHLLIVVEKGAWISP